MNQYINESINQLIHELIKLGPAQSTFVCPTVRTPGCMHTRQSPHEIVEDCSDEGGHRCQPLDHF